MTSPDHAPIPSQTQGQAVGLWGDDGAFDEVLEALSDGFPNMIRFFIALALKALGDAVGGIPWVGDALEDVLDGLANMILETQETANNAQETAETANTTAGTALTSAASAVLKADDAKIMAVGTYNYVENYGFELSAMRAAYPPPSANWSYSNVPGNAHSGDYVVRLAPPAAGYGAFDKFGVSDRIPTVPGDRFYVEWWQLRNGANYPAMVYVVYYNATDTAVGFSSLTVPDSSAADLTWKQYSYTTPQLAPSGTTYSRAYLQLQAADPYRVQDVVIDHGTAGYSTDKKMGTKSLAGTAAWKGSAAAHFISGTGADGGNLTTGTVECWFKIPTVSAQRNICGIPYWFEINVTVAHKLAVQIGTAGAAGTWPTVSSASTATVDDNTWHHAALVFDAGNWGAYLDGTQFASGTGPYVAGPADANIPNAKFWFGGFPGTTTYDFCAAGGLIDGLRISTTARYSATFTPPTSYAVDSATRAIFDMEDNTQRIAALSGVWRFDDVVVKKVDRGLEPRVTNLEGGGTRTVYLSTTVFTNPGTGTFGVACINGGEGGQEGQLTTALQRGGVHGGYVYREFKCADLALQLVAVVGAGGATNLGAGGQTRLSQWTGSAEGTVYAAGASGNIGSILTRQGAVASSSTPGSGGRGGIGVSGSTDGVAGGSSALASGGTGGPQGNNNGGAGGTVSTSEPVPCGGGGGGGGGYNSGAFAQPGNGGAGGAPGGGGGGGGNRDTINSAAVTSGGAGGVGRLIIIWRPGETT